MTKRSAAATNVPRDIEDLTEDQIAEVDRVLAILRGLRRAQAAAWDNHIECVFDTPPPGKFYFAGAEEDV